MAPTKRQGVHSPSGFMTDTVGRAGTPSTGGCPGTVSPTKAEELPSSLPAMNTAVLCIHQTYCSQDRASCFGKCPAFSSTAITKFCVNADQRIGSLALAILRQEDLCQVNRRSQRATEEPFLFHSCELISVPSWHDSLEIPAHHVMVRQPLCWGKNQSEARSQI